MAITFFPEEQNPDEDPELPQPDDSEPVEEFFPEPLGLPPGADPDEDPAIESFEPLNQDFGDDGFVETSTGLFVSREDLDAEQDEAVFRRQLEDQGVPFELGADSDTLNEISTKAKLAQAQQQATIQQRYNQSTSGDWRVRLRLAPGANYLYNDPSNALLAPLRASNGVIFPYTPTIQTSFNANYDKYDMTHSNYRGYFYKNSTVGDIQVVGTFTAQDTAEAEYLLAVIVFMRSVTKMFYGKDAQRGAPPPLVELSGFGQYQFNNHPCLITSFNYSLPNDVDYIRITPNNQGINLSNRRNQVSSSPLSTIQSVLNRLQNAGLPRGAVGSPGDLGVVSSAVAGLGQTTYVPTKMEIQLTLLPVQTRAQVSQQFSVKNFANGNLLKGGFW
jgi:hypothetical protein